MIFSFVLFAMSACQRPITREAELRKATQPVVQTEFSIPAALPTAEGLPEVTYSGDIEVSPFYKSQFKATYGDSSNFKAQLISSITADLVPHYPAKGVGNRLEIWEVYLAPSYKTSLSSPQLGAAMTAVVVTQHLLPFLGFIHSSDAEANCQVTLYFRVRNPAGQLVSHGSVTNTIPHKGMSDNVLGKVVESVERALVDMVIGRSGPVPARELA